MKIVVVQRVVPIYRHAVFEALRAEAQQAGHDLSIWYSSASRAFAKRGTEGGLSWGRRLPVFRLLHPSVEWQRLPLREALSCDVLIAPDNLRVLSNLFVVVLRRMLRRPVLVWGHGANFQAGRVSTALSWLRFRLLRLAHGYLVYTDACIAPLVSHGFERTRIGVTENAADASTAAGLQPQNPEVLQFRERHALGDAPCVVFLGSWYAKKRPDVVIAFGEALRRLLPDARVLVIGGGDAVQQLARAGLGWLTLLGPLQGHEKFVALAAARCLAVSGVAGLNLLDAMSCGLPVVVPLRPDHSPEVAYVETGINGFLVPDDVERLAEACEVLCKDDNSFSRMSLAARQTARKFNVRSMATNILSNAVDLATAASAQGNKSADVVLVYQRMLPYHKARFDALSAAAAERGIRCVAIQVSTEDASYGEIDDEDRTTVPRENRVITLFPRRQYLSLDSGDVCSAVYRTLRSLAPNVVFTPAPAFAEGAGALHYKVRHGGRLILMDDAWSATDHRGWVTRFVKRWFHEYVDGGFLPSPLHGDYFESLNIPSQRQRWCVNVVAEEAPALAPEVLPGSSYLLFVGRLIARKGLHVVLRALARMGSGAPHLVVVGDGPEAASLHALAQHLGLEGKVTWAGRQTNSHVRAWMKDAAALLVPSTYEQWGLVVNEAWTAGIPVLGSDTVGALRATYPEELRWMMVPAGNVDAWVAAIAKLAQLGSGERNALAEFGRRCAGTYSLERHVDSALELLALEPRPRPNPLVGYFARLWRGRVAVW